MSVVKFKFVGLLRGLLRRFDEGETEELKSSHPVTAAAPQIPSFAVPSSGLSQVPSEPVPVPSSIPVNPDEIQLPLQPILTALPMELRGKIMAGNTTGLVVTIPVDKVLPQLATGLVRISFGELRHLAPGVFANSGGELDSKPVALPLNQILAQINPVLLARRAAQKQVEISDDISSPFDTRGQGLKISTEKIKAPAPAPAPEPLPMSRINMPVSAAPVSRTPVVPPPPAFTPRWKAPAANGASSNGGSNGVSHGANGSRKPAGFDVPIEPAASHPKALPGEKPVVASLSSLSESWPEALKQEIDLLDLANAQGVAAGEPD